MRAANAVGLARAISCSLIIFLHQGASGQVVSPPITSSGLGTIVSAPSAVPDGQTVYNITGGTRPRNGPNLFHSFGEFGVPDNNVANFLNETGLSTSNILARVTGGNPSHLFGTVQTSGFGNANLFLLNPAGIVFGPNATLNVGGSVHFSTGDYLKLNDGVRFTAQPSPHDTLLSVASVTAFGFLKSTPGAISVEGSTLSVDEFQSISLVGGDVTMVGGGLRAPSGQVIAVSAASAGELGVTGLGEAAAPPSGSIESLGLISLSAGAEVDASGDVGGKIVIKGGQLVMDNTLADASGLASGKTGGTVRVLGERVTLRGRTTITASGEGGGGTVLVGGNFQGKGPEPNAINTYVGPDVSISADATTRGDGGNIIVWADEATRYHGSISARGGAQGGDGGFAEVSGKNFLTYRGIADLRAPVGQTGTLLLDPANIQILGGLADGSDAANMSNADLINDAGSSTAGSVVLTDEGSGAPDPFVVFESEIEEQSATADIVLEARNGITVSGTFDHDADGAGAADPGVDTVLIGGGNSLTLRTRNDVGDGTAGIDLTGSTAGSNLDFKTIGAGAITIETGQDGLGGGGSETGTAPVTLSNLTTAGGLITVDAEGDLTVNVLNAASGLVSLTSRLGTVNEVVNDSTNNILTTGPVSLAGAAGIGTTSRLDLGDVTNLTLDTNGSFDVGTSGVLTDLAVTVDPESGPGTNTYILADGVGGVGNLTFSLDDGGADLILSDVSVTTGNLNFALTTDNGGLHVGSVNAAGGTVSLTAAAGGIHDGADDLTNDITGTTVTLAAVNGIGGMSPPGVIDQGQALEVTATTLDLVNTATGDIVLTETDDVAVTRLDHAGSGGATLRAGGTITVSAGQAGVTVTTGTVRLVADSDTDGIGDLTLSNAVTTQGGAVELEGVNISISAPISTTAGAGSGTASGPVTVDATSAISLVDSTISTTSQGAGAPGKVTIRGGQFNLTNSTISADAVDGDAPPVAIEIDLAGDLTISIVDLPAITARTTGSGNAGKISTSSDRLEVSATGLNEFIFSVLDTHTEGAGNAGPVSLSAREVEVFGDPCCLTFFIESGTRGDNVGLGGDVSIAADVFEASNVFMSTGNFSSLFFGAFGAGTGGNVNFEVDRLKLNFTDVITDESSFFAPEGVAGTISVTGSGIELVNSSFSSAGGGSGGGVTVRTDELFFDGSRIAAQTNGMDGGDVIVEGRVIELDNGSSIVSSTTGNGDAGSISVHASQELRLSRPNESDRPSGIFSNSLGFDGTLGNSGDIFVETPRLTMIGGARINTSTNTSGSGGDVTIEVDDLISMSGQTNGASPEPLFSLGSNQPSGVFTLTVGDDNCSGLCGDAGDVFLTAGELVLEDGAQINSGTSSTGSGGDISINAAGAVAISGTLVDGTPGGLLSRTIGSAAGSGAGGSIEITAGKTVFLDGGIVSAETFGIANAGTIALKIGALVAQEGAAITSSSIETASGAAGSVKVEGLGSAADSISLVGSQVLTQALGSGVGGDIALDARQVDLKDSTVSTNTAGAGNAGNIDVTGTNQVLMRNNSALTTTAAQAEEGGNITVNAGVFRMIDSLVSSSIGSESGSSSGGDITINSNFTILQGSGSQVLANAFAGSGGQINITALNAFLADADSILDASSQLGVSGSVNIQSPVQQLSGAVAPLPESVLQAAILLRAACAARMQGGNASSLVQLGRNTVPAGPEGWLPSPLSLPPQGTRGDENVEGSMGTRNGITKRIIADERRIEVRGIKQRGLLNQAFPIDGSAFCARR